VLFEYRIDFGPGYRIYFGKDGEKLVVLLGGSAKKRQQQARVRISAPLRMNIDTIRVFAISKLEWVKKQQQKMREQARETPREYLDRESHYLWGKRYLLKVSEKDVTPSVEIEHDRMFLRVRPGTNNEKKQAILEEWYRERLKEAIPRLIEKWEPLMGVKVARFFVQRMKTKWGSCNTRSGNIRLNSELAKKPRECLEYVLVHELVHLLEPTHNQRFVSLMGKFMPKWQFYRDELNRLPVRHELWGY
jgi:predicted metal-dependent hydrolase